MQSICLSSFQLLSWASSLLILYDQLVFSFDFWGAYYCVDMAHLLPLHSTYVHPEAMRNNDTTNILAQIFVQM